MIGPVVVFALPASVVKTIDLTLANVFFQNSKSWSFYLKKPGQRDYATINCAVSFLGGNSSA